MCVSVVVLAGMCGRLCVSVRSRVFVTAKFDIDTEGNVEMLLSGKLTIVSITFT